MITQAWRTGMGWFMAPERGAAGRMGLFRVLFGLFYLWHVSLCDLAVVVGMPAGFRAEPIALFDWFPAANSTGTLQALDGGLVAALVLLAFGLRTQVVTAVVLLVGVLREAPLAGIGIENANAFLVFYIPLFMLVAGRWGDTYSLDAMLERQRAGVSVPPVDDAWTHFLAARATLVMLVALFATAPLFKVLAGGTWLSEPDLLSSLMLRRNVTLATIGLPPNPAAPWIAGHPPFGFVLQLGVLAFEGLFFLALFGRDLRSFFLATAMVFHAVNAFALGVTFAPILIVYGLFVDWEGMLRRIHPTPWRAPRGSVRVWIAAALLTGAVLAATWHAGARPLFNLGGRLNWYTVWIPVFPLAAAWSVVSAGRIVRRTKPRHRAAKRFRR